MVGKFNMEFNEYETIEYKDLLDSLSYEKLHAIYLFSEQAKEHPICEEDMYENLIYFKNYPDLQELKKHERCRIIYNLIYEFRGYRIRKGLVIFDNDLYVILDNHVIEFTEDDLVEIMWNAVSENKSLSDYILDII